jgi:Uma2 family endonuclease
MSTVRAIPKLTLFRSPWAHDDLFYPDSDGEPMADNDQQYQTMVDVRFGLQQRYRGQDVYVGANLLVYFEEGDASKRVAPDVFVALNVPPGARRTYLIWMEGKSPDMVLEIASRRTWKADVSWKKGLYQGLGIQEYFLFDPTGEYFQPILQGYVLEEETYRPIAPAEGQRGVLGVVSATLGLELWAQPNDQPEMPFVLRLWDSAAGAWLPTPEGEAAGRAEAELRAMVEAQARAEAEARADAAETRLRELEAELRRLRGEG